ncbi:hypothetical protein L9F63_013443 [Diploptera punctata]|uniref:Uncharacterized protein n=1 Tax=Diploptera punctata TaxID=6984 RepID=A0AAD8ELM9_DIPPU|nr:hypothetical protein L9F63_013443 [Diploptera punctata]
MKIRVGNVGTLEKGEKKNLTYILPNMYLHDRQGVCVVAIWYRCLSSTNLMQKKKWTIRFNTKISTTIVPAVLKDYYRLAEAHACSSVDMDTLNSCKPVNCEMKYSGTRNYYNKIRQTCEKIPFCIANDSKLFPDVAYNPNSNNCKKLGVTLTKEELDGLGDPQGVENQESVPLSHIPNKPVQCHHGYVDGSGSCVCEKGWASVPDQSSRCISLYHKCNVQVSNDWSSGRSTQDYFLIYATCAGALLALLIALLSICCHIYLQRSDDEIIEDSECECEEESDEECGCESWHSEEEDCGCGRDRLTGSICGCGT